MIVQHVRAISPAGAYQRPQAAQDPQTVTMGTPPPTIQPKVEPVSRPPRVSHALESSLSQLGSGG